MYLFLSYVPSNIDNESKDPLKEELYGCLLESVGRYVCLYQLIKISRLSYLKGVEPAGFWKTTNTFPAVGAPS